MQIVERVREKRLFGENELIAARTARLVALDESLNHLNLPPLLKLSG